MNLKIVWKLLFEVKECSCGQTHASCQEHLSTTECELLQSNENICVGRNSSNINITRTAFGGRLGSHQCRGEASFVRGSNDGDPRTQRGRLGFGLQRKELKEQPGPCTAPGTAEEASWDGANPMVVKDPSAEARAEVDSSDSDKFGNPWKLNVSVKKGQAMMISQAWDQHVADRQKVSTTSRAIHERCDGDQCGVSFPFGGRSVHQFSECSQGGEETRSCCWQRTFLGDWVELFVPSWPRSRQEEAHERGAVLLGVSISLWCVVTASQSESPSRFGR